MAPLRGPQQAIWQGHDDHLRNTLAERQAGRRDRRLDLDKQYYGLAEQRSERDERRLTLSEDANERQEELFEIQKDRAKLRQAGEKITAQKKMLYEAYKGMPGAKETLLQNSKNILAFDRDRQGNLKIAVKGQDVQTLTPEQVEQMMAEKPMVPVDIEGQEYSVPLDKYIEMMAERERMLLKNIPKPKGYQFIETDTGIYRGSKDTGQLSLAQELKTSEGASGKAPADIKKVNWLINNGIARDSQDAWLMINKTKTTPRSEYKAQLTKSLIRANAAEPREAPGLAEEITAELYGEKPADSNDPLGIRGTR